MQVIYKFFFTIKNLYSVMVSKISYIFIICCESTLNFLKNIIDNKVYDKKLGNKFIINLAYNF